MTLVKVSLYCILNTLLVDLLASYYLTKYYKFHKNKLRVIRSRIIQTFCYAKICFICFRQSRRESGVGNPPTFSGAKFFFHVNSENIEFLHVNKMWDFIYWTRHKWQKVDSIFWICCFSSKLTYHSYQQQVCKFLFLIRTFVNK